MSDPQPHWWRRPVAADARLRVVARARLTLADDVCRAALVPFITQREGASGPMWEAEAEIGSAVRAIARAREILERARAQEPDA